MLSTQLTHKTLIRYDKNIGYLFVPNITMRQPYSEKPYYIKTNDQGFRSDFDYVKVKEVNEVRIAFIGDSYTAGEGVANEKRFSDLVSKAFAAKSYNFGLSASGVDQQYLIYKDIASKFDHDVLVISPHIINIYRNLLSSRLSVEGQTGKKILVPKPYFTLENEKLVRHNLPVPVEREILTGEGVRIKLFRPNKLIRKLFHKYVPKRIKEELLKIQFKEHQGYEKANDPRWILMQSLLEGIIAEAGNIPIILAPLPYHEIHKNPNYRDRFIDLAKKYDNVTFVDILKEFKKVNDTDTLNFAKDEHYSEFGHQVIADEIIKTIQQKGILKLKEQPLEKSLVQKKPCYILGISAFYHDSACALIKDGEIIAAAQEERFTRVKNDPRFPLSAINYCLEEARIHVDDVEAIVFYDNPFITLERILLSQISVYPKGSVIWKELFPKWVQTKMHIPDIIRSQLSFKGKLHMALHHLSHAASAYYPSPFANSAILTIDGVGEWATATICMGTANEIKILKEMNFPHSVGLLYSAFTYYTGFKVNEGEYKLMGLAPYGEPTYVDIIKTEIVKIHEDGSIQLNMDYFGYQQDLCMINEKFESLFGGPARKDKEEITTRIRDIAKSIQVVTEEIVVKMAKHAKEITGAGNLCLAGGVALNCVANGKIILEKIFKNIWIQPAAGDSGGALGAALALYYANYNDAGNKRSEGVSLQKASCFGPSFSDEEIRAHLDSFGYRYSYLDPVERNKVVAKYLSEGKIAGHFQGGMEYGPRALGARSILGDPRSETTQYSLNIKIKFRESFRPFAPSVLEQDVPEFFNLRQPSPYMLIVAPVNEDRCIKNSEENMDKNDLFEIVNQKRSDLPAITHVDYSARVQSVNSQQHPIYYDLINEFKKITGYGVIINTSFNVNGEPIVCTPKDAVRCFMKTDMDLLVMNNFLLIKQDQKESELDKIDRLPFETNPKKNKDLASAQKDAMKLYDNYFPKFLSFKEFALNGIGVDSMSTWGNFSNHEFFLSDIPIESITPADIIGQWKVTPEEKKIEFIDLLKKLIALSKKHKQEVEDMVNTISDAIYVMFSAAFLICNKWMYNVSYDLLFWNNYVNAVE
jgi:carbamoyltransferase